MRKPKKNQALLFLVFGILGLSFLASGFGQTATPAVQAGPKKQTKSTSREAAPADQTQDAQSVKNAQNTDKVFPAFRNIREKTRTYVFLGWIWAAIFVLIYILRQKVKEVDRLHKTGYYGRPGAPRSGRPSSG